MGNCLFVYTFRYVSTWTVTQCFMALYLYKWFTPRDGVFTVVKSSLGCWYRHRCTVLLEAVLDNCCKRGFSPPEKDVCYSTQLFTFDVQLFMLLRLPVCFSFYRWFAHLYFSYLSVGFILVQQSNRPAHLSNVRPALDLSFWFDFSSMNRRGKTYTWETVDIEINICL